MSTAESGNQDKYQVNFSLCLCFCFPRPGFLSSLSFQSLAVLIFHNKSPALVPWYGLLKPFPLLSAALSATVLPWWSVIDTVGFIVYVHFVCEV